MFCTYIKCPKCNQDAHIMVHFFKYFCKCGWVGVPPKKKHNQSMEPTPKTTADNTNNYYSPMGWWEDPEYGSGLAKYYVCNMNKELLDKLDFLFESITCLCVEGPEFDSRKDLMDVILKEASRWCELIRTHNKSVEPTASSMRGGDMVQFRIRNPFES